MRAGRVATLAAAIALSGCMTSKMDERELNDGGAMTGSFDPQAAAYVLAPGIATVRGRFHQAGGLPGKFGTIKLIPDTPYAREHMDRLFRGSCVYTVGMQVLDVDPRHLSHMRVTHADEDGNFEFFGVPDGEYLVYAFRTSENVWFAHRNAVTVRSQQDVTVDVAC